LRQKWILEKCSVPCIPSVSSEWLSLVTAWFLQSYPFWELSSMTYDLGCKSQIRSEWETHEKEDCELFVCGWDLLIPRLLLGRTVCKLTFPLNRLFHCQRLMVSSFLVTELGIRILCSSLLIGKVGWGQNESLNIKCSEHCWAWRKHCFSIFHHDPHHCPCCSAVLHWKNLQCACGWNKLGYWCSESEVDVEVLVVSNHSPQFCFDHVFSFPVPRVSGLESYCMLFVWTTVLWVVCAQVCMHLCSGLPSCLGSGGHQVDA
jgi:hypothetical protein